MKLKNILASIIACSFTAVLVACGTSSSTSSSIALSSSTPENSLSASEVTTEDTSTPLVVYFSLPETASPDNMTREEENSAIVVNNEVLGNTQYVATLIAQDTGADVFRIEAAEDYPLEHSVLIDQANAEKAAKDRPEITKMPENINQYNTIFLGYSNWWGDMPMILYTFLENVDLSGKTIIPFNTHGGSGFSNTISTISTLQPNATVIQDGYSISRDDMEDAPKGVEEWLAELEE